MVFPGQDYNNARVYDFADVKDWEKNQRMCSSCVFEDALTFLAVDRTKSSRMGWSDVALSMNGKIVHNLVDHFVDRW